MISLLSRIFIKDRDNVSDGRVRSGYSMLCCCAGIFLNLVLFAGKYAAGRLAGSVAITADAFNNLSDAGSSLASLLGLRIAGQKPDADHPFGHGRMEYISGLFVAVLIIVMGFELLKSSAGRIFAPQQVETGAVQTAVLVFSIIIKGYMAFYNYSIGKRINSIPLRVTAADSLSDIASTSVVLVASLLSGTGGIPFDGIGGLLVSLLILWSGVKSAREIISTLLGQPADSGETERLRELVMSFEGIVGVHDIAVHDYGPGRQIATLHAEVPADSDLLGIHDVIDRAEKKAMSELGCELVIHIDPVVMNDSLTDSLRERVCLLVSGLSGGASVHDFRVMRGEEGLRLEFDAALPYSLKMSDGDAAAFLASQIAGFPENCTAAVKIDRV